MLDANTKKACKDDPSIREIKIKKYRTCYWTSRINDKRIKNEPRRINILKKKNIGLKTGFRNTLFNENSMNINLLIFKRVEFMQRKLICIFED